MEDLLLRRRAHPFANQAEFVDCGEAAIERWKQEGGGRTVDEVMVGLQGRLDDAKRRAAERTGR
jgi:hypothetical protein